MALRYFGWTTTRFGSGGTRHINRYRRYGKKTYRTGKYSKLKPSSTRRFNDYL